MWREDKLPLVNFYQLCSEQLPKLGYEIIICLIARYSDIPKIYENLEKHWSSLHDVTGKSILFLFAGDDVYHYADSATVIYQDYSNADEAVIYSDNLAILPFPNNNLLKFNSLDTSYLKNLQKGVPRLEKGHDVNNSHTLQISQLREFLKLSENDIPGLYIYHIEAKISQIIKLDEFSDIYQLLKSMRQEFDATNVLIKIRENLNEIRRITAYINQLKYCVNKLENKTHITRPKQNIDYCEEKLNRQQEKLNRQQEKLNRQQQNLDIQVANYTGIIKKISETSSQESQIQQKQNITANQHNNNGSINTEGGNYTKSVSGNYIEVNYILKH